MKATIKWLDGVSFKGSSESEHSLIMDGAPESGGKNLGMRPMELMLLGIGGCTSYDIVTILKKSRQDIKDCKAEITAERAETIPQVFTKIHLHFILKGNELKANVAGPFPPIAEAKFSIPSLLNILAIESPSYGRTFFITHCIAVSSECGLFIDLSAPQVCSAYKPKDFLTIKNFQNALTVLSAIGGSTNGMVHLTAMAGRLGIDINLNDFDQMTKDTPMIVDLKPSGSGYMEDLFKSGGLPRILNEIRDYLHLDTMTVSGISLKEVIDKNNYDWPQQIIRKTNDPIFDKGSIAVLNGNLAPGSAIIKQSAASKDLLVHEGIVEVFEDLEDLANRIDSEDLNVTKDSILLLRNIGPLGAPGMPEAGLIPIPKKLAKVGVKDMVRISDGRMSGTASGTIVLHVCPEAAAGGNLNIVESGDVIKLDVNKRLIELKLTDEEIKIRHNNKKDKKIIKRRGYNKMFYDSVLQADKGVDFDFLRPVK